MKTLAGILLCLFLVAAIASPATVVFNLVDIVGDQAQLKKKTFVLEPLTTVRGNTTNVVTSERRFYNLGANAILTVTNLNEGTYRCHAWGQTWTSVFRINIPSTNGTLSASHYITTGNAFALESEEGQDIDIEEGD